MQFLPSMNAEVAVRRPALRLEGARYRPTADVEKRKVLQATEELNRAQVVRLLGVYRPCDPHEPRQIGYVVDDPALRSRPARKG